jgi:hypothetical protein
VTHVGAAAPGLGHAGSVTELTTKRLELRRWREEDLDEYPALIADPEPGGTHDKWASIIEDDHRPSRPRYAPRTCH